MMSNPQDPTPSVSYEYLHEDSKIFIKDLQQATLDIINNYNKGPDINFQDLLNVGNIYGKWLNELACKPEKLWGAQLKYWQEAMQFIVHFQEVVKGKDVEPFIKPDQEDKRFNAIDWHEKPLFYFYQQMYLLTVQHVLDFVKHHPSESPRITKQVNFFTGSCLDALAPTNFIFTNPEVIRHTLVSKGENLAIGFRNYLEDILRGQGHWNIKMTEMNAFEIGKNLAVTPGKVIFQNRLMQLIQYQPTTDKVYQRPLLIVPPWINKYYILDLKEKNSLVKWVIDQGYTVFMISWVNPDESYRNTTFEDYIFEGIFAALDAIQQATNETTVNALGFCIGGTLLATALGLMKARNDHRIKSATFLTTLLDFSEPGEIEALIDEEQISTLEKRMKMEGYLDGRLLMTTFNFLRANDLLWSYYINNYLCGKTPFPFDLLYWNCDSTNMPEKMHSFYLRELYLNNKLSLAELIIDNTKIDLTQVDIPSYFLSAEQDHIAPWPSTFDGAKLLGGPVTFVLAGSGHIAGVINSPLQQKYQFNYGKNDDKLYVSSSEWLANSLQEKGSWWNHWLNWLAQYSGENCNARIPGEGELPVIQEAPGDYVKRKIIQNGWSKA
ncbi:MAG: PHA/PHB synthase family protein [Candidatus Berkiellales bacterium]